MRVRAVVQIAVPCLFVALCGCRTTKNVESVRPTGPPPTEEIIASHNERVSRMPRVWSRAVVQMEYLDADGKRRSAQGEGHFQFRDGTGLALSVGKLGETLFWLGADMERHWVFELGDADRALVGRHENAGGACSTGIGAPIHPLDLLDLVGLTPVDDVLSAGWSDDGRHVVVSATARSGIREIWFDAQTGFPSRVTVYSADDPTDLVSAELSMYEGVELSDVGGFFPRLASRIIAEHEASESRIQIDLSDMNDGRERRRLPDAAFQFDTLVRALGPDRIIVLDELCEHPALTPEELAQVTR